MQYSTATHDGFCKILFPVTDLHWILWVRHRIYLTRILDYQLTRFGYCCDDVFQPLELLLYLEPHCSLFLKKGSAIACFLSITLHSVPPESTKSHSHLTRLSWDWPFYKGYLPFTDEIRSDDQMEILWERSDHRHTGYRTQAFQSTFHSRNLKSKNMLWAASGTNELNCIGTVQSHTHGSVYVHEHLHRTGEKWEVHFK